MKNKLLFDVNLETGLFGGNLVMMLFVLPAIGKIFSYGFDVPGFNNYTQTKLEINTHWAPTKYIRHTLNLQHVYSNSRNLPSSFPKLSDF